MTFIDSTINDTIAPNVDWSSEGRMVGKELWEEIRRLHQRDGQSISALARRFDLDRKTVKGDSQ